MTRTDDVSLWPWPLTLKLVRNVARVVMYHLANFRDTTTIRCRFMGYWAWVRVSGPGETSDQSASSTLCCLDGGNWQITVFWRQNSGFRKRFSKIVTMLRSLIRILVACLVQIDPEMAEKCSKNNNQWYAVRSYSENMPQGVCQN